MENRPKVGVGVIVRHEGKVLLGKRRNAHGDGSWCLPGGHLEFNETIEDCARREVLEETGISIRNIHTGPYTNDIFLSEGKHYLTVYAICDYDSGIVKLMEPHKCEGWEWFCWDKLPSPLFIPIQNLKKQKYSPF
jgi:8-oxo-dGTP diphosphatase